MQIAKNTPEVWDKVWSPLSEEEDRYYLDKHRKSIEWARIKSRVLKKFGSFKGIKSIEIGAGEGLTSLLFALEGAEVTILDFSPEAIKSSKLFFKRNNIKANFILMDALNLDKKLLSKYDVSMSFGTAEHFSGDNRIKFIQAHFNVLRKDGITFISVPNKWNLIYRLWKFLSQSFGRWQFADEFPFSRAEFRSIGKKLNVKFDIIGGYLFHSHFLIKRRLRKFFGFNQFPKKVNYEIGTPLDKYFAQTIVAIAKKD